jgi:hypothetical protein
MGKGDMFARQFKFDHSKTKLAAALGITSERGSQISTAVNFAVRHTNKFSEAIETVVNTTLLTDVEMIFALVVLGKFITPPLPFSFPIGEEVIAAAEGDETTIGEVLIDLLKKMNEKNGESQDG